MSFEFLDDFQDLVAGKSQLHGLFNALHGGGGGNDGHNKCVQQLLQHSAIDVSIQDKDGYNCLAVAAKNRELLVNI